MAKLIIPDTLTEEEVNSILYRTNKTHHKLAIMLGFYECMRVSEVVGLQPEDIDKDSKLIHIRQSKGSKDRMIPIAPEVERGLKHLPIKCGARALQIMFRKKVKEILNKNVTFHTLRHSGITHYIVKKKWSSLEVQRLAGHSKISTTELYTHVRPQHLVNRMWE